MRPTTILIARQFRFSDVHPLDYPTLQPSCTGAS